MYCLQAHTDTQKHLYIYVCVCVCARIYVCVSIYLWRRKWRTKSLYFQLWNKRGQHSSNRVSGISTRTMHQSTTPSLSQTIWPRWASRQFLTLPIVQSLLPVTFGYSLSSEAAVMRQLMRWKRLWRRSLTHSHKRTSMEPSRKCWNGRTSALQPEEINAKGTRVSCVYYK